MSVLFGARLARTDQALTSPGTDWGMVTGPGLPLEEILRCSLPIGQLGLILKIRTRPDKSINIHLLSKLRKTFSIAEMEKIADKD